MSDETPSFEMTPKKGFFGIGKSKAECFTCPKAMYTLFIEEFGLSKRKLQHGAVILIDGIQYPFTIRFINMNRSKVRKLLPSRLTKRIVIQFSWKTHTETMSALKVYLNDTYFALLSDEDSISEAVRFNYLGDSVFEITKISTKPVEKNSAQLKIIPNNDGDLSVKREFQIGREYRDTGRPKNPDDQFMRWINIEGSGIKNAGGIRGLRSLRSGHTGLDCLLLITSHEPGNLHNPWVDQINPNSKLLYYWGDAKAHETKELMDFQGNKYLVEAQGTNIPILHFVRQRRSFVKFTGLYHLEELEKKIMIDKGNEVLNLLATLRRTEDMSVGATWLKSWRTEDQWELRTKDGPSHWLDHQTNETQLPQASSPERIVANVPSSFVHKKNKLAEDRGNGEAKLYIGPVKRHAEFDLFFHNWHPMNTYEIDVVETLLYLQDVEDEFSKQSKYKAVSRRLYSELFSRIDDLDENRIDLTSHQDKSRYYIRGSNKVWKLIREISLPLITSVSLSKTTTHEDGSADFVIKISRSDEVRNINPTSGNQISQKKPKKKREKTRKNDAPRVPDDELKDRVWRRDQGMCQANWRIDSSFDKNSGDICGSNENLEFDHIVPYSKGGKTTYRNLQLLCQRHNRMKSNREI